MLLSMSVVVIQGGAVEYSTPGTERRYNVYPQTPGVPSAPRPVVIPSPGAVRGTSHLHRNVAAFGEITVMPVGEGTSDNDNVRVAVDEEVF